MSGAPESVWDYPRPPRVEPSDEHVEVMLGGVVIASTRASYRVLETSHPPTYYLPEEFQPGAPPKIITTPYEEDVKAMQEDIRAAKQRADVVIVRLEAALTPQSFPIRVSRLPLRGRAPVRRADNSLCKGRM